IPRLELMAAVLLSKLIEKVMLTYSGRVRFDQVYAWSDASIVLAWLHSSPHEWKTFVSNRVSEILRRVPLAPHPVGRQSRRRCVSWPFARRARTA
ncbi:hypothetical protein F3G61_31770, partial [Pseudomonas aeruginosa]